MVWEPPLLGNWREGMRFWKPEVRASIPASPLELSLCTSLPLGPGPEKKEPFLSAYYLPQTADILFQP